ncbi:MAG: hypothetical protein E6045_02830 [Finegoldia magna]|nr:hypothetical protein [Finegoldia magna]
MDFTRKCGGASIGKLPDYLGIITKKYLIFAGGESPFFSCFALALQEKTPESVAQLRFLAR